MLKPDDEFEKHVGTCKVNPPATVYKYMSIDTARKVLSRRTLRLQSPLNYNDPFDSQWNVFWSLNTPEARAFELSLLESAIRTSDVWPVDACPVTKGVFDRMRTKLSQLPKEQQDREIAIFCDKNRKHYGMSDHSPILDKLRLLRVLCFCESDQSILMWSHYADQHRGVVLGFDRAELETSLKAPLRKVKYSTVLPEVIDSEASIRSSIFGVGEPELKDEGRSLVLTKYSDWAYEQEWRFVGMAARGALGDHEDIVFPGTALVEVVYGCNTDSVLLAEVLALSMRIRPEVQHFQMSMDPDRFKLVKTAVVLGAGYGAGHGWQWLTC